MKPMLNEQTDRAVREADSDSDSCDSEGASAQMFATRERTTGMGCLRPGSIELFQMSLTPVANRFHAFSDDDTENLETSITGANWTDLAQARETSKKLKG